MSPEREAGRRWAAEAQRAAPRPFILAPISSRYACKTRLHNEPRVKGTGYLPLKPPPPLLPPTFDVFVSAPIIRGISLRNNSPNPAVYNHKVKKKQKNNPPRRFPLIPSPAMAAFVLFAIVGAALIAEITPLITASPPPRLTTGVSSGPGRPRLGQLCAITDA